MLGTVLSTGVSSIVEFHCRALNKTDTFPALNHHARLLWETVRKSKQVDKINRAKVSAKKKKIELRLWRGSGCCRRVE